MLTIANTVLLVVDVQGNLAHMMDEKQRLFDNLRKMIEGAHILEVPIIVTEQNPAGLGRTIPEIAYLLTNTQPISKMSFSCCRNEAFLQSLQALKRQQILITGIETHICVYQTTVGLLDLGYEVQVVVDAVASRTADNKAIGLEKMKSIGASVTSTEMALYELLQVAEGPQFKRILKIIK